MSDVFKKKKPIELFLNNVSGFHFFLLTFSYNIAIRQVFNLYMYKPYPLNKAFKGVKIVSKHIYTYHAHLSPQLISWIKKTLWH